MSPWVDDPDTGTSYYEKPKRKTNRELQREAEKAAGREPAVEEESFGAKMARLKREKAEAQAQALDSLEVQGS